MARRLAARPGAKPRCRTSCEEASTWSAARNRGSTPAYDRAEAAAGIALYAWPRCPWAAAGPERASRHGPGCGARGRWRGLARLRDDAPSEARGADGERAGRRPRALRAARPDTTRPGIQKTDIRIGCRPVVELGGFEPPTFSLRTRRATNCAIAPRTQTA